ncbi:MAG: NACHT and WD repeat domain-containing protein [Isosphaeraceae bacterium]
MSEGGDEHGLSGDLSTWRNPFVGPGSIPTGRPLFGRDREVRDLYRVLLAERIVLLHGPSGCGKSSLINAGLIPRLLLPRLRRKPYKLWPIIRLNREPAADLKAFAVDRYTLSALNVLVDEMGQGATIAADDPRKTSFCDFFEAHADGRLDATGQVLIFDQFEEVITTDSNGSPGKESFFEGLGRLLKYPGFHAVFSMRDEYVGALETYRKLIPRGFETRVRLDLLRRAEAIKAIVGPTAETPAPITQGAATVLVDELSKTKVRRGGTLVEEPGQYVEPVQLQVVCYRLWAEHLGRGEIGEDLVRGEAGDINSALADFYNDGVDAVLKKVPNLSERRVRDWCEHRLITAQGTRGQVQEGDKTDPSLDPQAIEALIGARIVRAEERRELRWYELAHDRLIEPVRTSNASWRDDRLQPWQRRAALYDKQRRAPTHAQSSPGILLLTGSELATARSWADAHPDEALDFEKQFLVASTEREEARTQSRQLIAMIGVLVAMVLLGSMLLLRSNSRANEERIKTRRAQVMSSLTRGLDLCQYDNKTAEGLHWLVRGLEQADQVIELEPLIREEISVWSLEPPKLKAILSHEDIVGVVALSPDGKMILTGSEDTTARLWDARTGQPRGEPLRHDGHVVAGAFSPDSQTVLTGSADRFARLWDRTGKPVGNKMEHGGSVIAVAFSPDGQTVLTGSTGGSARLWDRTSKPIGKELGHGGSVVAVAFSRDGETALTGSSDGSARLWDARSGENRGIYAEAGRRVSAVVGFSPDGKTVLTGVFAGAVRLGDLEARHPREQPSVDVNTVAFSRDGKTALTGNGDRTAVLWDVSTGRARGAPLKHEGDVVATAVSPDNRTALTGSVDGTARLWDVTTGRPRVGALEHGRGADAGVNAVAFGPDSKAAVTGSSDSTARLWELNDGRPRVEKLRFGRDVTAVAFGLGGRTALIGGPDKEARLWDLEKGLPAGHPLGHGQRVVAVALSEDGMTALTGSRDNTARLWDVKTGIPKGEPLPHGGFVLSAALSPDGQTAITGCSDNKARLWKVKTGQPIGDPLEHEESVGAVALSPDGRTALTGSYDSQARLWDLRTGMSRFVLMHDARVLAVAFSRGGRTALTGSADGTARLWEVNTGQPTGAVLKHQGNVGAVALSPDGRTALTGSRDNTARLWDVKTGIPIGAPLIHDGPVIAVGFGPEGQTVLTACEGTPLTAGGGTVRLWFLPERVDASPAHLRLWVEVITGRTMDDQGGTRMLKVEEYKGRQQQLRAWGGPPEIVFPSKARRSKPPQR